MLNLLGKSFAFTRPRLSVIIYGQVLGGGGEFDLKKKLEESEKEAASAREASLVSTKSIYI